MSTYIELLICIFMTLVCGSILGIFGYVFYSFWESHRFTKKEEAISKEATNGDFPS